MMAPSKAALVVLLATFACYPARAIQVNVWTNVTDEDFVYPELDTASAYGIRALIEKPSLGIAVSGGGWKAAALTYGWLRAMYLLSITSKAQYISSNSGGGWAAAPFAYTMADMSRFFSPYYESQNLTVSQLSSSITQGSWGQAVAGKSLIPGLIGNPASMPGDPSAWATNVASIFLSPFGIGSGDSSVSAAGTNGDILKATRSKLAPGFPVSVACNNNRPYPIQVGALMLPDKTSVPRFFPFEFTPLYVGMAPVADSTKPTALGGGFVEPVGFGTLAPRRKVASKQGNQTVDVTLLRPTTVSSLAHFVGISSSAVALATKPDNIITSNLFSGQMLQYWNLWDYKSAAYNFMDGGAVDNLAIMPLLRRGVRNLIVCVATHTNPDGTLEDWAKAQYAISGLFGALPENATDDKGQPLLVNSVNVTTWNAMEQVFPFDAFEHLFQQYKASYEAGGAHLFSASYEVLPNDFHGVNGGYTASVLWVLNGKATGWESQLPTATQRWMEQQRQSTGPYKSYPNVVNVMEAPAPLITLLSQQASWTFRAKKEMVLEWVRAAVTGGGQ